ncbi:MAG: protein kinase, partial [Opitutaceae bacterium]
MSTNDPNSNPTALFAEGHKLAGCYVLIRQLSAESGAEVWLAQDEVLGKNVSLHFIPDAVRQDTQALQALRQDIKRDRQLVHPNILRVYDLVEEPDWAAISMDASDGESLAAVIERQPHKRLKVAQIQSWIVQLVQTLDDAHKINVLHRDIAPANLLLTPAGKVIVTDFGISRVVQDALNRAGGGEKPRMAYVSPQLLDGDAAARTDDVYSLGAVLYALLTGAPPFVGENLGQQIRAGLAPANVVQALRKEGLGVPPEWQKIIAGCLEKSPEVRPQSAAEVARRLATEGVEAAAAGVAPVNVPIEPARPAPAETPVKKQAEPAPKHAEPAPKHTEASPEVASKEPESIKSSAFVPP